MRLPRVRFTMQRMMIAVAVFAVGLEIGLVWSRAGEYRRQARYYASLEKDALLRARIVESGRFPLNGYTAQENQKLAAESRKLASYLARMKSKYEWAAVLPWLRMKPDPPPPSAAPDS